MAEATTTEAGPGRFDLDSEQGRELVRQVAESIAASGKLGAGPVAPAPRFGTTGFLDPTLEYFVRNELEKLETRLSAKIEKTEAGLKEHLEKELRKVTDSFGDRINKALMWGIGAVLVLNGLAVTVAHYWVIPGPVK
jgi:hypothetical protein